MNKTILKLAIPNIISNISVPLISSVDTALMGHLSASYLAALGVGSMIFMFLYSSFGFLRMGTTGLIAQSFGSKDFNALSKTLYQAIILSLLLALPILLFNRFIFEILAIFLNVESSYYHLAKEYFDIRVVTAPAVFLLYVLTGLFFGLQNARYPLYIALVINILNAILSIFFVKYLKLDITGVALGSVIAQYIGLIYGFFLLRRYKKILKAPPLKALFHWDTLKRFFGVNQNIFIRTIALTFSLAFFYSQSAKGGEVTLSVMVLLLQFMIWLSFAIDGFANSAESLIGKYFGAKDFKNLERAFRVSFLWGFGLAILFSFIYLIAGDKLILLYSSDIEVISRAKELLLYVALLPLISFSAFIYDGVFIGLTAVKAMRNSVLIAMALYITLFFILKIFLPLDLALWLSFMSFFSFRGLLEWFIFKKRGWELN